MNGFAAGRPSDSDHVAATSFMRSNLERLVTSDYIYNDLVTLLRTRGQMDRAKDWVDQARLGRCEIVRITDSDVLHATEIFFNFADKQWSFTDCTCRVVMERLGVKRALAFDEHFRQFGTVEVVP